MAKINQYPAKTVPSNNDEFVLHDPASGSTKKMTRGDLIGGAPLPANSVDLQAINGGTTAGTLVTDASGDVSVQPYAANDAYFADSTTSVAQTYTALPNAPSVTVAIGQSGMALVSVKARLGNNTANSISFASFAVSGATTIAASDDKSVSSQAYFANSVQAIGGTFLVKGLTPGSNTFTHVNRTGGNTGQYAQRYIAVVPL